VVCAGCHKGYIKINEGCFQRATCKHGIANNVRFRGTEDCKSCIGPYVLKGKRCLPRARCEHGIANTGLYNGADDCKSCNSPYVLTGKRCRPCPPRQVWSNETCVKLRKATCRNGSPKEAPIIEGDTEDCKHCYSGYAKEQCKNNAQNECCSRKIMTCDHGTAQTGTVDENANSHWCVDCHDAFWLDGNVCRKKQAATCSGGEASHRKFKIREGEDAEDCATCKKKFSLQKRKDRGRCVPGICNHGRPPTTVDSGKTPHGCDPNGCDKGYWYDKEDYTCKPWYNASCKGGVASSDRYQKPTDNCKKCHNPDKFTLVIKKGKGTCVSSGCQNGKAIEATEDVKGSKQTDCDPNGCFDDFLYDETTKQCLASYKTTCNNGKPKDNNYHMQPTELCSECHKGFGLNKETNTCAAVVCANGKAPFPYSFKGKANLKTCASCDTNYYLCPNGICYYDRLFWHDTCP